jgi:hypothetical protein
MTTATIETLIAQFTRTAARTIRHGGKVYTLTTTSTMPILVNHETSAVTFAYMARKARGSFMASKVSVTVRYDAGADLYDITFGHFDGDTIDSTELGTVEGAYTEAFSRIGDLLTATLRMAA